MRPSHHAQTLEAALDVNVQDLMDWVQEPDFLQDVTLDAEVVGKVVDAISNPTSFQHFADGYCLARDNYFGVLSGIDEVLRAKVSFQYDADCPVFEPSITSLITRHSPGYLAIKGDESWGDQEYPSAPTMVLYYTDLIKYFVWQREDEFALRTLCHVLHYIQDMTVPHHVLGTIGLDHALFEREMERWALSAPVLDKEIRARVEGCGTLYELVTTTIEITRSWLPALPSYLTNPTETAESNFVEDFEDLRDIVEWRNDFFYRANSLALLATKKGWMLK